MIIEKKQYRQEIGLIGGLKLFSNSLRRCFKVKCILWLLNFFLDDKKIPYYFGVFSKFSYEKFSSNYFFVLTRRYQEGKMQGEELFFFENELREELSLFKEKLQGYLEGKVHGEDLDNVPDRMVSGDSLLNVYLKSSVEFNELFSRFRDCISEYEPDPIERKHYGYYGDEELAKMVKEVLAAMEHIHFPTIEERKRSF